MTTDHIDTLDPREIDIQPKNAEEDAEEEEKPREWPFHLKLATPIKMKGVMLTELTFRRGCLGDGVNIDLTPGKIAMNDLILIASRLAGQTTAVIKKLEGTDAKEAVAVGLDFIATVLADR